MTRTTAIVVAAGSGQRLGLGQPKAFVRLAGAPLLVHAVRALGAAGAVDDIVVVAPPGHCQQAREHLAREELVVAAVCPGGDSRASSVARGLEAMPPGRC